MSDDVIDLDAARKQVSAPYEPSRVLRRKRDGGRPWCPHKHYVVSMTEAEVECADCQAPLDPWTVLRSLATEQERLWVAVALERAESARLRADITMLKEARAKLRKQAPKAEARVSLDPTDQHRWRVHIRGRSKPRVSPWMTEVDARRIAKRHRDSRVEEHKP